LRRLAGKTQVVGPAESDFPRTRLTHSLECAQIGREIAVALGTDADLVDAACLAHDLGHPPFGHNGEQALNEAAHGAAGFGDCGGFEGNAQSLRLLTRLETKVPGAGLNLTRATLDAACKYPWPRPEGGGKFGVYADDLPVFTWIRDGSADVRRPIETRVMDWADDVAYSVHDFEDGVEAGRIDPQTLDVDAIVAVAREVYLPGTAADTLRAAWTRLVAEPWWTRRYDGGPASSASLKGMTSELIGRFSAAAVLATRERYGDGDLERYGAEFVVPADVRIECALMKAVAVHYVMRPRETFHDSQRSVVHELVGALMQRGEPALEPLLRPAWREAASDAERLRVVIDQVAGLTDAGAMDQHARLVGGA